MIRLNRFMGNVCTVASSHNIHAKLQAIINIFHQESVDGLHHLPRVIFVVVMDMCTYNAVRSHRLSLTSSKCLPFSDQVYTCMILIILCL